MCEAVAGLGLRPTSAQSSRFYIGNFFVLESLSSNWLL